MTTLSKILAALLTSVFAILLFASPVPASANGFCWWGLHPATAWKCAPEAVAEAAGGVAAQAMEWMIGIFNELLSKVVAFFAFVLNWTFDIQEITNIDVIQFAWSVSRDFANMFFILILLAIAFATILRYEPYGIKRLLPKLVLVALLINFSMVGAGVIIDLGSSLGHFFVTGGAYDESANDIGANIAAAVGIQNLNNYEGSRFSAADVSSTVVNSLFSLVLTAIIAFLFVVMAGFMIVRLVALWMLVIFVPLALVSWVIPVANKYWKMWWNKFFAWAFFPAIFGIFIYFALIIGNAFQNSIFTELGSSATEDSSWFTVAVQSFLQMLIVVFILLAGLKYARSAGLDGAGLVVKWSDKAKDAALGYTKDYSKRKARTIAGGASELALYNSKGELRKGAQMLGKTFGARQALRPLVSASKMRRDDIKKEAGKYKDLTPAEQMLLFKTRDKIGKAATLYSVGDKVPRYTEQDLKDGKIPEGKQIGDFNAEKAGSMTEADFNNNLKALHAANLSKDIINAAPHFAKIVGESIEKILGKMDLATAGKIKGDSLMRSDVQEAVGNMLKVNGAWDKGHIAKLYGSNPKAANQMFGPAGLQYHDGEGNVKSDRWFQDHNIKISVREYFLSYLGKMKGSGSSVTPGMEQEETEVQEVEILGPDGEPARGGGGGSGPVLGPDGKPA